MTDFGGNDPLPTTAESIEIVSTSTDDASGGIGANAISISYLDSLYVRQNAVVLLDGTNPVALPTTAIRINLCVVVLSGTSQGNVGDLTIRSTPGGVTRAFIPAGNSVNRQGIYTTPADHTSFIERTPVITGRNDSASVEIITYSPVTNTLNSNALLPVTEGTAALGSFPVSIPERTDYYLRAINNGGGSVAVSGIIPIIEIDNAQL